jgi:hypothetical protein
MTVLRLVLAQEAVVNLPPGASTMVAAFRIVMSM